MLFPLFLPSTMIKHIVVDDEEVDIHDLEEVELALATRFQAEKNLFIVNDTLGLKLGFGCTNSTASLNEEPADLHFILTKVIIIQKIQ